MKIQLELRQEDSVSLVGVVYSRGIADNSLVGCDFLLKGLWLGKKIVLDPFLLVRNIRLDKQTCNALGRLTCFISAKDSLQLLEGRWDNRSGKDYTITFHKVAPEISVSASQDLADYFNRLYDNYDKLDIFLEPHQRKTEVVAKIETDEKKVVIELKPGMGPGIDSVSLFLNGEMIVSKKNISIQGIRLIIKLDSINENTYSVLTVVNESREQKKLDLHAVFSNLSGEKNIVIHPTHTANTVFFIRRNPDH